MGRAMDDFRAANKKFKEDMRANNAQFKKRMAESKTQRHPEVKETTAERHHSPRHQTSSTATAAPYIPPSQKKKRTVSNKLIITFLVLFWPVGLYLLWKRSAWRHRTKVVTTAAISACLVAIIVLAIIFAPPSLAITSSMKPQAGSSYTLAGTVNPGDTVTVNGKSAVVSSGKFTINLSLNRGDNNLDIVVHEGSKITEKHITIHRYTDTEIAEQKRQAAEKKAREAAAAKAAAEKKATDEATAKKQQQEEAAAKQQQAAAAAAAQKQQAAIAAETVSQKNAVSKAKDYLNYTAFSHDGLVDQLVYDQFSTADATYGADHSGANWNQQAAKKAKDYMSYSSFSRGGLIDQLEYDKFTPAQATYGVNAVGL